MQLVRVVQTTGAEGSKTVVAEVGKLSANSGIDIGDVDVTSITPGTGATNLGKAEDAAHSSGDVGVMMLGVINYSGAGADADYAPITLDAGGVQRVRMHKDVLRIQTNTASLTKSVTAYTAGDQVGGQLTMANAARASGGTGRIIGASLLDVNDIIGAYDVAVFRASITPASDNAAFAISDGDADSLVALIQLAGAYDIGNNRIAQAYNLNIPYDCYGGTSLYCCLITRFGHTFFTADTDLHLTLWVERD